MNVFEQPWSVLESMVRSRFPPPSLKQLQDVFVKRGTVFHQRLFRTYMSLFQEGYILYYRQTVAQLLINKEMCVFHDFFQCFLAYPVYIIHILLHAQYVRYVHNCTEYPCTQFGSLYDFSLEIFKFYEVYGRQIHNGCTVRQ